MSRAVVSALFCAVLCSYYASCAAYQYEDCGSTLGSFTNVSVSNCRTEDEKCTLIRGTNATILIKFIPNTIVPQVNVRVYGVLLDVPIPFPVDKPDACKDPTSGVECPLKKNQEYTYSTTMFVQRKFPSVSVNIQWELQNAQGDKIVCILFPARIATIAAKNAI